MKTSTSTSDYPSSGLHFFTVIFLAFSADIHLRALVEKSPVIYSVPIAVWQN
jgi:hypothetical protein